MGRINVYINPESDYLISTAVTPVHSDPNDITEAQARRVSR